MDITKLKKKSLMFCSSQKPNWDYHAEVQAFSNRLHENFSLELLKRAFVNPCYLKAETERRQGLGMDSEITALILKDNIPLSAKGEAFTKEFLADWCRASFPSLPIEGTQSVIGHLSSLATVTYVATNLGIEDLTMSAEFPVPDEVLYSTFMAVIGALQESSGAERAGFFLRVRGTVWLSLHRQYNYLVTVGCQDSPLFNSRIFS